MSGSGRRRLIDALDASLSAGRPARFWLRDDDAVTPTPALERLLALSARHGVPLTIAAIPAQADAALARLLAGAPDVVVAVHGWSHANHAPAGEKKQELGLHRPAETVLAELGAGVAQISALFGDRARPVLVPPWNRIDADLLPALPALGYAAISVFGAPLESALPALNATLDIIDWHGTRGGRDAGMLFEEAAEQVERQRTSPTSPAIGVLTHHLVHDEAAWAFVDDLAVLTAGRARWLSLDELLDRRSPQIDSG